ncbi:hypothetical protein N44_00756 [Microcystis aeruginosa NIES-44]|uniref:Uncharacterized protein n=1 Tax=Microcystis aeruginosa NIES-44 TaxID=449439 RepID=A0A0A1VNU9_MICAE|nr:hypothetical protein N44_00756 [Microcystis aeruginosa NIES-44]
MPDSFWEPIACCLLPLAFSSLITVYCLLITEKSPNPQF